MLGGGGDEKIVDEVSRCSIKVGTPHPQSRLVPGGKLMSRLVPFGLPSSR